MYTETKTERFWRWAEEELDQRGLNWYRVEQQAGVANGTISRRAREQLEPTLTTITAIADTFDIPRKFVFQKAGAIPPQIIGDDQQEKILDYYRVLDARSRKTLLAVADALYKQQEE